MFNQVLLILRSHRNLMQFQYLRNPGVSRNHAWGVETDYWNVPLACRVKSPRSPKSLSETYVSTADIDCGDFISIRPIVYAH